MGSTLTNTQPKDTYKSLLKTSDSSELSATAKYVSDGNGNDSALALSNAAVGIGTSAPDTSLHIELLNNGPQITLERNDATINNGNLVGGINFVGTEDGGVNSPISAKIEVLATENWVVPSAYGSDIVFSQSSKVTSVLAERFRITENGVTFNGDTAAANALDDYEEGTFTATITPSTSGTITSGASFTTWTYTKIGRQVTINGVFVISSVSLPVGTSIVIGGLPFTIFNNNGAYGAFSVSYFTSATSSNAAIAGRHGINATSITVGKDASTVAASDEIYVTATYFV